ncbi:hypothetical protein L5G32_18500 [Gordonia sp. HY002]|uniref:alpha/beta fold hydrolase n=1 Tax=Gordonia zhenghanii TaxID=2911516 RepID=UPI001EF09CDA|nr:hypothetical protein [Gordonia zhenghanii]MCF8572254.1 hypothetical protein [Gordonia zhenghanii]MCF8607579.1 hypothetical protein [Gordonia zhenghanii]
MTTTHDWDDTDQLLAVPPTDWIDDAITSARLGTVAHLVTSRFDRYARVLYPAQRTVHDVPVEYFRWADVARVTGAIAHARMQWDAIADIDEESPLAFWNEGPSSTNLIPDYVVAEIAAVLGGDDIPGSLIHGRRDISSPVETAWRLHRSWPGSTLMVDEGEGHGGASLVQHWAVANRELIDRVRQ